MASVALIGAGGEEVIQPFEVSAFVDYDYTDPGSPQDLMFRPASKNAESIMQFSLGQLDSYEGASDDASSLVFRKLAEKIADQLVWKLAELE
jgi:hypothetical protein